MLDECLLVPVQMAVLVLAVELGPRHGCELLVALLGREAVTERQVGVRVPIRVDQCLVDGVRTELVGVRRRQRVDVQDQDRASAITRLLWNA